MDTRANAACDQFFDEERLIDYAEEASVTGEWRIEPLGPGHRAVVTLEGTIMGRGEAPQAQTALDRAIAAAVDEHCLMICGDELQLELA